MEKHFLAPLPKIYQAKSACGKTKHVIGPSLKPAKSQKNEIFPIFWLIQQ